jgi:ELWxxDGT repeat protein
LTRFLFAIATAFLLTVPVQAANSAYLVKDINTIVYGAGSNPDHFVTIGNLSFFTTNTGNPLEIWRTDGTEAGTFRILDGGESRVVWNGRLWFTRARAEVWSTDGTVAGTRQLLLPEAGVVTRVMATATALYVCTEGKLWVSDGTTVGTRRLGGAVFIGETQALDEPTWAALGETLVFGAGVDGSNWGVWAADGTSLVQLAAPNASYVYQRVFMTVGSSVYFQRTLTGWEKNDLWKSDGTAAGTHRLDSAGPIILSSYTSVAATGSSVYFSGADSTGSKLWRSTEAGVTAVASSLPGVVSTSFPARPLGGLPNGTVLLDGPSLPESGNSKHGLWAFDGTNMTLLVNVSSIQSRGTTMAGNYAYFGSGTLWRTDGTASGTIDLGAANGTNSWPMASLGNNLLFGAIDLYGHELWKSDGTIAGTSRLKDVRPATNDSSPANLVSFRNGVLFNASPDAGSPSGGGARDIWFSDGTEAGTQKLVGNADRSTLLVPCGGRAFFAHYESGSGSALWATDGSPDGTAPVKSGISSALTCVDGTLFFGLRLTDDPNTELWRTDGTARGTILIKKVNGGVFTARYGHRLFLLTAQLGETPDWWISDGTADGTIKIAHASAIGPALVSGLFLYLQSGDGTLWRTDGTAAGTIALPGSSPSSLTLSADFSGRLAYADRSRGLCTTSGSPDGVQCFDSLYSSTSIWKPSFWPMNGRLYYNYPEMKSTDGATSVNAGTPNADQIVAVAGGRLYYVRDFSYPDNGRPFLETDGTPAGTRNIFGGSVTEAVASGGRLFIGSGELYAYDLEVTPTALAPQQVDAGGGATVTISGRGFTGPVALTLGGAPVTVTATSPTAISFVAPPRAPGTYDLAFTTGDGRRMNVETPLAYVCAPPVATIGATPGAVCPLAPVILHGSGGNCHWFPSTGLDNAASCDPVATLSSTTTYTLVTSNTGGCQSTNYPTVTVSVLPPVSAVITADAYPLASSTYTASVPDAGPGATYAWTVTGAQLQSAPSLRTVTYVTGCIDVTLAVTVTSASACSNSSSQKLSIYNHLALGTPNPFTANPGTWIYVTATGPGVNCISTITVLPASSNGGVPRPLQSWTLTANGLQFRLPPETPPWYRLSVTSAGPSSLSQTGYAPKRDDFTGEGRADILWRNPATGTTLLWTIQPDGALGTRYVRNAGTDYEVVGVNEFGGYQPTADVTWRRRTTGAISTMFSSYEFSEDVVWPEVPPAGVIPVATGDLDNNGAAELVMRNLTTGETSMWSLSIYPSVSLKKTPIHGGGNLSWTIVGSRDFDGDGKSDILWRNSDGATLIWFMNGAAIRESRFVHMGGNTGWTITGLGDFDGDTKADILWRNADGTTLIWFMDGTTIRSSEVVLGPGNLNWAVAGVGDFNADGKADVLWREVNTGQTLYWQMNGSHISTTYYIHPGGNLDWKIEGPRF